MTETVNTQSPTSHIQENELHRYIVGELANESVTTIETHLTDCRGCKSRLDSTARVMAQLSGLSAIHEGYDGKEKRTEPRFATGDSGVLQTLSPLSTDRVTIQVRDVSKSGLGLLTPMQLEAGTVIQVRFGSVVAFGEVRYSIPLNDRFQTGVRVQDVSDWK